MSKKDKIVLNGNNVNKENYFLYCYQPLNGVGSGCVIQVEPYRFASLEEANNYASILRVLRHNDFLVMTEDEVRSNFNVIVDEVQIFSPESLDERCSLCKV